jgi:hypothetical protein
MSMLGRDPLGQQAEKFGRSPHPATLSVVSPVASTPYTHWQMSIPVTHQMSSTPRAKARNCAALDQRALALAMRHPLNPVVEDV